MSIRFVIYSFIFQTKKIYFANQILKFIQMKKLAYVFMIAAISACQSDDNSGQVTSRLAQEGTEDFVDTPLKTTTLSFNKMEHDFGNVRVGEDYTFKFLVTNTGKNPLIIEDAKASCGCTVPDKPDQPIAPGKSDEIVVTFSPKPGQGVTSKTVTVTANTEPKITTLTIRANVIEGMEKGDSKPATSTTTEEVSATSISTSPKR